MLSQVRLAEGRILVSSRTNKMHIQTTTFYTHWLDGQGKYEAFRKSQLKALEDARTKRGCGHPFYWAGFIYAGQP